MSRLFLMQNTTPPTRCFQCGARIRRLIENIRKASNEQPVISRSLRFSAAAMPEKQRLKTEQMPENHTPLKEKYFTSNVNIILHPLHQVKRKYFSRKVKKNRSYCSGAAEKYTVTVGSGFHPRPLLRFKRQYKGRHGNLPLRNAGKMMHNGSP